ncbi:phosphate signaling complex protein PhoU [Microbacterium sp. R86528]|uniref:phosphate signaling complex protein PhoU n=1 Tax=Microbacterium sp. R86528 TaxID=3093864 RepID=UPI0037CA12E8
MREVFHQSLEDVQDRLIEISEMVTVAIDKATRAFGTSDVALAEEVIEADAIIDEKAIALDELAIEILARQQPVARDLRVVVSALRTSASLERMGDIAEHIAQLTRMRFPERAIPRGLKGTFRKMGEYDVEVARALTELLRTQDLTLVEKLRDADDKLDELHASVFEKVLSDSWRGEAGATVDATLASRYHERFADHAVSVAKKVAYLATGDWVVTTDTIGIVVASSTPETDADSADVLEVGDVVEVTDIDTTTQR